MARGPGVLLVGHDASRTGAPIVAAEFARWAATTGRADVRSVLLRGGPLLDAGPDGPATWPSAAGPGRLTGALGRVAPADAHRARLRRAAGGFDEPPVVVANTVAAWAAAAGVRRRRGLVCWVHELDDVADALVPSDRRAPLVAATDAFVAVDPRVATMLTDRWGVEASRVEVIGSFVDPPRQPPTGDRTVLGAGALVPRKGADQFVATLAQLRAAHPDVAPGPGGAAWLGGPLDQPYADLVRADRRSAGLDEVIDLPGLVDDLDPWWPATGVLLHPARVDPAPLVVLEAALRAIPVVTWDTGGAADLVRAAGDHDLVAAPGDLMGLADRLALLLRDPERRVHAGRALRDAASGRTTDQLAPVLLDRFLATRTGSGRP